MNGLFVVVIFPIVYCANYPKVNVQENEGFFSKVITFNFNRTTEQLIVFSPSYTFPPSIYPYRVKIWSFNATIDAPVFAIIQKEQEVLSWQIPFVVPTSTEKVIEFRNTSRTLCPNNLAEITKNDETSKLMMNSSQKFILTLSTFSFVNVDISVLVQEEQDFLLNENKDYSSTISCSEPKYYYYKFNNNTKLTKTMINIISEDDVCLIVSVQDAVCPVFDLDKDITGKGKSQTINLKGGIIIDDHEFPHGFFLVFVAKTDNSECIKKNLYSQKYVTTATENRTYTINFIVKEITKENYTMAILLTLGFIGIFWVIAILAVFVSRRWGTIPNSDELTSHKIPTDCGSTITEEFMRDLLNSDKLTLDLVSKTPIRNRRRASYYSYYIWNISIFYGIPVVQLVFQYQSVVNTTGNQDLCYHNFLCANPTTLVNDFNHVISNVVYIFTGLLFLGVVWCRSIKIPSCDTGIPVHYGIYYAMGGALIMEGLFSACYHICPSQSNFQFDTTFMYAMLILCLIKLYHNRHPDFIAAAGKTFLFLGFAILLAVIGILTENITVWIIFDIFYFGLCIYISFKINYSSFAFDIIQQLHSITNFFRRIEVNLPAKTIRFLFLVIGNIFNFVILIAGLFFYSFKMMDFGTYLLIILTGNLAFYKLFYSYMKYKHGEKLCIEAKLYLLFGFTAWLISLYLFSQNTILWSVSPAESRQKNQECMFINFYDKHDLWHFSSAIALYLTFMFLLCLDDDIIKKKREEIIVF